jgi:hypothetical protein
MWMKRCSSTCQAIGSRTNAPPAAGARYCWYRREPTVRTTRARCDPTVTKNPSASSGVASCVIVRWNVRRQLAW